MAQQPRARSENASHRPEQGASHRSGTQKLTPSESRLRACSQRRAHTRFAVELDVDIGSEHELYQGFVENLSAGGTFVATHLVKPVGSLISLCIHLPDGTPIRGLGEVRWRRDYDETGNVPPGLGVRFVRLELGADGVIDRFLSEHAVPPADEG